ncbi:MAG: 2-amino-4-ketopentanoate thiolase [Clostridia bacterium]|nr:2-amino-4-ketopentanoate thiolase [Clostridia bacterium]
MKAKKGDWVRIYNVVLKPEERAESLPEDTKKVPLEMWDKGFLMDEYAALGDIVEVETIIGRKISGKLLEIAPNFDINFGTGVTETMYIGRQLKELIGE